MFPTIRKNQDDEYLGKSSDYEDDLPVSQKSSGEISPRQSSTQKENPKPTFVRVQRPQEVSESITIQIQLHKTTSSSPSSPPDSRRETMNNKDSENKPLAFQRKNLTPNAR